MDCDSARPRPDAARLPPGTGRADLLSTTPNQVSRISASVIRRRSSSRAPSGDPRAKVVVPAKSIVDLHVPIAGRAQPVAKERLDGSDRRPARSSRRVGTAAAGRRLLRIDLRSSFRRPLDRSSNTRISGLWRAIADVNRIFESALPRPSNSLTAIKSPSSSRPSRSSRTRIARESEPRGQRYVP